MIGLCRADRVTERWASNKAANWPARWFHGIWFMALWKEGRKKTRVKGKWEWIWTSGLMREKERGREERTNGLESCEDLETGSTISYQRRIAGIRRVTIWELRRGGRGLKDSRLPKWRRHLNKVERKERKRKKERRLDKAWRERERERKRQKERVEHRAFVLR